MERDEILQQLMSDMRMPEVSPARLTNWWKRLSLKVNLPI